MKEIAASAAALAGLLAFAYVSQQPVSTRNKRATITIDETEELDGGFTASLESFQNLTNEQASALWLDLTGEDVTQKQAVNRNDKVRYNQIGALHNTMNEAWVKRWNRGRSYLRGMAPQHGNCENSKFIRKSTCDDTVCKNEPEKLIEN